MGSHTHWTFPPSENSNRVREPRSRLHVSLLLQSRTYRVGHTFPIGFYLGFSSKPKPWNLFLSDDLHWKCVGKPWSSPFWWYIQFLCWDIRNKFPEPTKNHFPGPNGQGFTWRGAIKILSDIPDTLIRVSKERARSADFIALRMKVIGDILKKLLTQTYPKSRLPAISGQGFTAWPCEVPPRCRTLLPSMFYLFTL